MAWGAAGPGLCEDAGTEQTPSMEKEASALTGEPSFSESLKSWLSGVWRSPAP